MPGRSTPRSTSHSPAQGPFRALFAANVEPIGRVGYGSVSSPKAASRRISSPSSPFTNRARASWVTSTPAAPQVSPVDVASWPAALAAMCAPAVYIALYCAFDILAAKSSQDHGGYYNFQPACMVLTVELGKLFVSLVVLAFRSATGNAPEWPSLSRLGATSAVFVSVAACFATGNVLMLVCLAKVSLAHYTVWYQTSILFNAVLWFIVFRRPFGFQRTIAMVVLGFGCVINSITPGFALYIDSAIIWVVMSAFIASLGCVLNEYFMKKDFTMDIFIQNAILYVETSLCCIIIILYVDASRLSSPYRFFEGFHGDCWALAGLSMFIGLCVSWILKYASLIVKTFAVAIHCPIEIIAAHWIINTPLSAFTLVSGLLIGVSTFTYATAPKGDVPDKLQDKDRNAV